MSSLTSSAVEQKIQDLCSAIASDPDIRAAWEDAEAFLADEPAVALYREMTNAGRQLQEKHRSGESISDAEFSAFQTLRDEADGHPLVRSFCAAQEVLQEVAETVHAFVSKTLEQGSVPTSEEVFGNGGGCGHGCGCHH